MTDRIVSVSVPTVPHGPVGVPVDVSDADYYRNAARAIRYQSQRSNSFAGQNVTETVAQLCLNVADALDEIGKEK